MGGLYIHVPFCGSICSYCHFARTADHDARVRRRYVEAVCREFELRQEQCSLLGGPRLLETTYIGGGTPSLLEPELMATLLAGTVGRLEHAPNLELTVEANPESFADDKAQSWHDAGVNRVSLGIQSLNADVLRLLGRACPPQKARQALKMACKTFDRVSADWILGPGLQDDALRDEIQEAIDLGVDHFSVYILELHPGTGLERRISQGKVSLLDDEDTEAQYLAVVAFLAEQGFPQYEVSNFSRPGSESRHNRGYWQRKPWLALGCGGHGGYGRRRYANEDELEVYCRKVEGGRIPEKSVDPLTLPARMLERVILRLRTSDGVPLEWLGRSRETFAPGTAEGLWKIRDGRLFLTGLGFLRIDSIESWLAGWVADL